jgi:hypothetical protein
VRNLASLLYITPPLYGLSSIFNKLFTKILTKSEHKLDLSIIFNFYFLLFPWLAFILRRELARSQRGEGFKGFSKMTAVAKAQIERDFLRRVARKKQHFLCRFNFFIKHVLHRRRAENALKYAAIVVFTERRVFA